MRSGVVVSQVEFGVFFAEEKKAFFMGTESGPFFFSSSAWNGEWERTLSDTSYLGTKVSK